MAIRLAKKYGLIFPKEKKAAFSVLKILGDNENVEVEAAEKTMTTQEAKKELAAEVSEIDYLIASLKFAISYLSPFQKKSSFWQKFQSPKIMVKKKEKFERDILLEKNIKRVIDIEREREEISREKKEIVEKLTELEKFQKLDFLPTTTKYTEMALYSLPQAHLQTLKKLRDSLEMLLYFKEICLVPGRVILLLVFCQEHREQILKKIKQMKGEEISYEFAQVPEKILKELFQKKKEIEKQQEGFEKELCQKAKLLNDLKIYHDLLLCQKTKIELKTKSMESRFLNYLSFYSLEENKEALEKKFKKISPEISIIGLKEEKGNLPVILENNKIVSPLQYVTEIFGLPRATEIDPTPFMAIFFIIFFGICLTDAGYGFFLSLASILGLILLKKRLADTRLVKLLFYGGLSTIIMGVLFGSYFGITAQELKFFPYLTKLQKIDPMKDTLLFLGLAFALGYLQLFFSQIVKIISGIKNKNRDFIESGFAWALLYICGALALAGMRFPRLLALGLWGAVFSALFIMFSESRGVLIFLKPLLGFIKLVQGLINTMSDVLSYSRLMALGLATSIIALIVNQIAFIFKDLIPFIGWPVAVAILIVGHIFNLGINALGGFIHSGRLQFVEFFPKFLEGGGRRFKPLKPELKYIEFT